MKLIQENHRLNQTKAKLFYLGILTIICLVIWISVSIYASFFKSSIDPKINTLIKPLNPVLDSQVIIDYQRSRVAAPEQFLITTIVKNTNQANPTIKIIDPLRPQATIVPTASDASSSAGLSQE